MSQFIFRANPIWIGIVDALSIDDPPLKRVMKPNQFKILKYKLSNFTNSSKESATTITLKNITIIGAFLTPNVYVYFFIFDCYFHLFILIFSKKIFFLFIVDIEF